MSKLKTATAIALALGLSSGLAFTSPAVAADQQKSGSTQMEQKSGTQAGQSAQSQQQGSKASGQQHTKQELQAKADELIGQEVVNKDGTEVGELEDIVVDNKKDQPYAVIEVGGVLGMGGKQVAIPFDQLKVGQDNITLMSQKSEDELKQMPAYQENQYTPLRESGGSGQSGSGAVKPQKSEGGQPSK